MFENMQTYSRLSTKVGRCAWIFREKCSVTAGKLVNRLILRRVFTGIWNKCDREPTGVTHRLTVAT